jgi:hypothetical protein
MESKMGMTLDKLKKDAEEAEAALLVEPKPPEEPKDPAADPPVVKKEDEPAEPPKDPGVTDPPVEGPKPQTAEELQEIIKGLKLQLESDNNPTAKQQYSTLQGMFNKLNDEMY